MSSTNFTNELFLLFSAIDLAFPNDQAPPPEFCKFGNIERISFDVALKLLRPESRIALRHVCVLTSGVLMPKTTMHEKGRVVLWKNDVGFPMEFLHVKAIAEAIHVQEFSDDQLGGGIFALNARHHPTARRLVDDVSHHASS